MFVRLPFERLSDALSSPLHSLLDSTPTCRSVQDIRDLSWRQLSAIERAGKLRVGDRLVTVTCVSIRLPFVSDNVEGNVSDNVEGNAEPKVWEVDDVDNNIDVQNALNQREALHVRVAPGNERFRRHCEAYKNSSDIAGEPSFQNLLNAAKTRRGARLIFGGREYHICTVRSGAPNGSRKVLIRPTAIGDRFRYLLHAIFGLFPHSDPVQDVQCLHRPLDRAVRQHAASATRRHRFGPPADKAELRVKLADRAANFDLEGPVDFRNAIIAGASDHVLGIAGVKLKQGKLDGTRFTFANLSNGDLSSASLRGARFLQCDLSGARFHDANLHNTSFEGIPLSEDWRWLDDLAQSTAAHCGQIQVTVTRSWEGTPETERGRCEDLLRRLRDHEDIRALPELAGSAVHLACVLLQETGEDTTGESLHQLLLEFLTEQPHFTQFADKDIQDAVLRPLDEKMEKGGHAPMEISSPGQLRFLMARVRASMEGLKGMDRFYYAQHYSPAIVQMLMLAQDKNAPDEVREQARRLKDEYLKSLPKKMIEAAERRTDLDGGDETMIPLVTGDATLAVLITSSFYEDCIRRSQCPTDAFRRPWTALWKVVQVPADDDTPSFFLEAPINLTTDLARFPLLANALEPLLRASTPRQLLYLYDLGEYRGRFELAFVTGLAETPLMAPQEQQHMTQALAPLSEVLAMTSDGIGKPVLTADHAKALLDRAMLPDTPQARTCLFLCLGAVWTRLASNALFGTDNAMPPALRQHALALLNTAGHCDSVRVPEQRVQVWIDALNDPGLSGRKAFTLSKVMVETLRRVAEENPLLRRALGRVWPDSWNQT